MPDGRFVYETRGNHDGDGKLLDTYFELDTTVQAGKHVDFVVGNGGNGTNTRSFACMGQCEVLEEVSSA